jgi:4-hydroxy-tetrahydrodipicolinate synthase
MINQIKYHCDYIMLTVPYYNKPNQEGLEDHFKYLANNNSDAKFVIYNVPGRTGVNLEVDTLVNILKDCPNIIGIKEASGDLSQMMQVKEYCPDLQLYSGDDGIILPVLSIGGVGVISVISNLLPEVVLSVVNEFFNGNIITAQSNFYSLRPFVKFCFIETNPVPIKYMLSILLEKNSMANVLPGMNVTRSTLPTCKGGRGRPQLQ